LTYKYSPLKKPLELLWSFTAIKRAGFWFVVFNNFWGNALKDLGKRTNTPLSPKVFSFDAG